MSGKILAAVRALRRQGIEVLYLDKQILVLNKPNGLITQSTRSSDVSKQAQSIVPTLADLREKLPIRTLSTVHRLDKSTTGCLVLTKTESATKSLSRQFSERSIGKTYLALVDTRTNAFQGKSSGLLLTGWTSDDGRPEIVPVDAPEARRAMTDWKILASSPTHPVSLLRLNLHTGLKHQLRLHCASSLQAPIIGDALYTPPEQPSMELHRPSEHTFLHALEITITRHIPYAVPLGLRKQLRKSKRIRLTIGAPLPSEFRELCARVSIPLLDESRRGHVAIDGIPKDLFFAKQAVMADSDGGMVKDEDGVFCTTEVFPFSVPELEGYYFARAMLQSEKSVMEDHAFAKEDPPHLIM